MEIDQIYREYGQMVYRFLVSLTNDSGLSEELTQETFYQAIKASKNFKGESKVSTWLCQIAKNLWFQHLAKEKRQLPSGDLTELEIDPQAAPADNVLHSADKVALFKAIHTLNEISKEVVLLRINGDFSFKEIGEVFAKSENWARVTFYRAKQKISERMNDHEHKYY